MPYNEPYSAWFDAVVAALLDEDGPFAKAAQVEYWVDEGIDDLLPDERLLEALTRNLPHALVCWPGGGADATAGGGNSQRETVEFTVRYACGAPGEDFANALKANGTHYWGAWAVHDWILGQVFGLEVVGFETPAELVSSNVVRLAQRGVIGMALRFTVRRLRTHHD